MCISAIGDPKGGWQLRGNLTGPASLDLPGSGFPGGSIQRAKVAAPWKTCSGLKESWQQLRGSSGVASRCERGSKQASKRARASALPVVARGCPDPGAERCPPLPLPRSGQRRAQALLAPHDRLPN
jgi:hypothetical protein